MIFSTADLPLQSASKSHQACGRLMARRCHLESRCADRCMSARAWNSNQVPASNPMPCATTAAASGAMRSSLTAFCGPVARWAKELAFEARFWGSTSQWIARPLFRPARCSPAAKVSPGPARRLSRPAMHLGQVLVTCVQWYNSSDTSEFDPLDAGHKHLHEVHGGTG